MERKEEKMKHLNRKQRNPWQRYINEQQESIAEQPTGPLFTEAVALQGALQRHRLSLLAVAQASGVRYVTAWRLAMGLSERPQEMARLRAGLARLLSPSPG